MVFPAPLHFVSAQPNYRDFDYASAVVLNSRLTGGLLGSSEGAGQAAELEELLLDAELAVAVVADGVIVADGVTSRTLSSFPSL